MLDDPVTAQYTHTLTVTRRLGGLYTCTVANDKPSQDSANFTIQGIIITRYSSTLYVGIAMGVSLFYIHMKIPIFTFSFNLIQHLLTL